VAVKLPEIPFCGNSISVPTASCPHATVRENDEKSVSGSKVRFVNEVRS
jgi:hypothetical protein